MQLVGAPEELDARHLGHLVVRDEQGDGLAPVGLRAQAIQGDRGGRLPDDLEVAAEPPTNVVAQGMHDAGVVIDHEQDGPGHLITRSRAGCSG